MMTKLLNNPKKKVAVDLMVWLGHDPSRTLSLDEWRERGVYELMNEGIGAETFWYVINNGFPRVSNFTSRCHDRFGSVRKKETNQEIESYQREYREILEASKKDDQRRMILYLKDDRQLSNRMISKVIGRSEGFVQKEYDRTKKRELGDK